MKAAPIALALLATACAVEAPVDGERTGAVSQPIQGGMTDEGDTNVVAIANMQINELCSGSLIAPNLVLTAAHCVSAKPLTTGFFCSNFAFAGAVDVSKLLFTNATTAPQSTTEYAKVKEVLALPAAGDSLCDRDVALVILEQPIDTSVTPLLVPRVDEPVAVGEAFNAIGYGQIGNGSGIGTRRRLDGLSVGCAGACNLTFAGAVEWVGHPMVAHTGGRPGDSGSPALDATNRVAGIFIRHKEYPPTNTTPDDLVYSSVTDAADFIKSGTLHAAELGGYEAPAWANGAPTNPNAGGAGGMGGTGGSDTKKPPPEDDGCSTSHAVSPDANGVMLLGVGLAFVALQSRTRFRARARRARA